MGDSFHAAALTIRPDAMAANYRLCRELSGTAVAGVVKADAYGLGLAEAARAFSGAGCDSFFVARLEEGIALRALLPKPRIFMLDGAPPGAVPALIAHNLTPVLNSLAQIEAWQSREKRDAAVHLDTGMSRLGLSPDELGKLVAEAKMRLAGLNPVLVMSHLACADDPEAAMNREQLDRFRAALARLPPAPASLASSGGVLLGRDYAFDLVRPGIGLYGGNPHHPRPNAFRTVARLTGTILQTRRVDAGQSVGYGASHRFARPATLATVALGYADGLMRAVGNRGKAAVAGKEVPIVGRVSMDLLTLDVSALKTQPKAGDEAEFFGDTISLERFAEAAGTISYEVLTRMSPRLPRRYEAGS